MDDAPALPPPAWATLTVASCNLLNLALPGRAFYANQAPYASDEYERKVAWLGGQFARLNADLAGVQEVWDEAALRAAVAASGLRMGRVVAPGAEQGAESTPRVGLVSRWPLESMESLAELAPVAHVEVPGLGPHRRFERPVLRATVALKGGRRLHVLVAHLKSKRPKFLQDAAGNVIEDRDDPLVAARASLRSLVMRGAEATGLRALVIDIIHRTREPLVLLGDMNDSPHSVTSQLVAASTAAAYDRAARDVALYHAPDVATEPALKREMGYSHVHQGWPDVLDQVWVSEEFVAASKHALGDVRRVEYFNDHLHEGRDRIRSDHGFARALLRLRLDGTA